MKKFTMSLSLISALACSGPPAPPTVTAQSANAPDHDLSRRIARFAPTDIAADISALPPNERQALTHLIRAAQVMDALFLEQVWAGNEATMLDLLRDQSDSGKARLHYFLINKGPWSRLDHNEPFVPGAPAKPASANYYPADATKEDVERWLQSLPADEKARATGFFTTIRRAPDGRFAAVPYSSQYQGELEIAARHLGEAANATAQPSL
jgi:hypothetical protein